jgi:plastocyanin
MGKPTKGGFPSVQPTTRNVNIQNGKIDNITIAWGDSIVWMNKDPVNHQLAALDNNGNPDPTKPLGPAIGPVGSPTANTPPFGFPWTQSTPPPATPTVFAYGCLVHPNEKATVAVLIKV